MEQEEQQYRAGCRSSNANGPQELASSSAHGAGTWGTGLAEAAPSAWPRHPESQERSPAENSVGPHGLGLRS